MREIKFRAWDEQNRIMHNDFQFVKTGDCGNDWILFVSDKQPVGGEVDWMKNPYFSQQLKISQYTGLKDKKGKEICEGDILVLTEDGYNERYKNGMIFECGYSVNEFDQCGFYFYYSSSLRNVNIGRDAIKYEVIGNIYENPELLRP